MASRSEEEDDEGEDDFDPLGVGTQQASTQVRSPAAASGTTPCTPIQRFRSKTLVETPQLGEPGFRMEVSTAHETRREG